MHLCTLTASSSTQRAPLWTASIDLPPIRSAALRVLPVSPPTLPHIPQRGTCCPSTETATATATRRSTQTFRHRLALATQRKARRCDWVPWYRERQSRWRTQRTVHARLQMNNRLLLLSVPGDARYAWWETSCTATMNPLTVGALKVYSTSTTASNVFWRQGNAAAS